MTSALRKPPKGITRTAEFTLVRSDEDTQDDGLTLEGYAAVFNSATEIDSWEGNFREIIMKGAFRRSIREMTPVLQFDHGRHPLIGSIPIGKIRSLSEDDHGLAVVARITDNWLTQPVREAIRDESINGMSFRFEVMRDEWTDNAGKRINNMEELQRLLWDAGDRGPITRTLKELKVQELGPVVWPAYQDTEVSVRSREVVHLLRDPLLRAEVETLWTQQLRGTLTDQEPEEDAQTDSGHPSEEDTRSEEVDAQTDSGHPSRSVNLRRAQLARINGYVDVAERTMLRHAR